MDYPTINHQQAKALLNKYWAGESSLKEEAQIRHYFQQGDVEESLRPYRSMFVFFAAEQQKKSSRVMAPGGHSGKKTRRLRLKWRNWMGVAASVLLLVSVFWLADPGPKPGIAPERIKGAQSAGLINLNHQEQAAFEDTKEALMLLSTKLNTGKKKALKNIKKIKTSE